MNRITAAPLDCAQSPCRTFRSDIEESIQDELCDAGFYAGIADEAPNETLKLIAWTISRTEFWHAELQQALLASNPPSPSPPPACPKATGNFCADVQTAIHGELTAVIRYAQLAMCAPTITSRLLFMALLLDESSHVGIWTAMLNTL